MPRAAARLEQWRSAGDGETALDDVRAALDDNLDTPAALAFIDAATADGRGASEAAALLGVS
jgi:L-cysteine:1D-myo-inositol 2-amino-2-deoxy-alpha-D-glucopyranoside ligase